MAFSKTPQTSTYQTKDVSLLNQWETRDSTITKDNDAINCFYELVKNKQVGDSEQIVVKRDGTVAYPYVAPTSDIRGIYYWEDKDKLLVAVGTDIVIVTASTGITLTTLSTAFATTTGEVGFVEFLYDTNNIKVVATDGTTMITIDSTNTKVVVTDTDLPVPHIPTPVFLDGYLFIVKTGTGDIYNSDLNDPTSWTPGDFITAEMSPDTVLRIANLNNYIIVFGSASIEYFFDAANSSGSPLQRYDTPYKMMGYIGGLSASNNDLYFVGNSVKYGVQIFKATDLKIEPIGSPPIRRLATTHTSMFGTTVSYAGHDFYVLSFNDVTYQYDLETKLWTRLAFKNTSDFLIKYSLIINIAGVGLMPLIICSGDATMYYFKEGVYKDNGVNFTITIITDPQDFDTMRQKTCSRLLLSSDESSVDTYVNLSWTDDDYKTFSAVRTINLNSTFRVLHRLGQFRRRAFKLTYTDNYPLRVRKLELDLNMGQA